MKFDSVAILVLCSLMSLVSASLPANELMSLIKNQKKNYLKITDSNYQTLLNGARDHHFIVLLTSSSSQINCVLCHEFKPEYEVVVDSYYQDHPNGLADKADIFFGIAEFSDAREFFQQLHLQSIPKVYHYGPSEDTSKTFENFEEYQFYGGDLKSNLITWLSEKTGEHFNVYEPYDYGKAFTSVIAIVSVLALFVKFAGLIGQILSNKQLWSGISLVSILLFTSGYMFNAIRNTQYMHANQDGTVNYFVPGHQQQLGVETQIISFVYGGLSVCLVALVRKVPTLKSPPVHLFAVILFASGILVLYSSLLCIFQIKSGGYPYKLLELF